MEKSLEADFIADVKDEDQNPAGPGQLLRKARSQMGLSTKDISSVLHLSEEMILALESDDYTKTPGLSFAKGYLRMYAKHVKICPTAIMDAYKKLNIPEPKIYTKLPERSVQRSISQHFRTRSRWNKIILIALIVAVGVWWFSFEKSVTTTNTQQHIVLEKYFSGTNAVAEETGKAK